MNTEEVALKLVGLCRAGKWMEAVNTLQMGEAGVYTVKSGEVTRAEFLPRAGGRKV
jgi:hypothetical protein